MAQHDEPMNNEPWETPYSLYKHNNMERMFSIITIIIIIIVVKSNNISIQSVTDELTRNFSTDMPKICLRLI